MNKKINFSTLLIVFITIFTFSIAKAQECSESIIKTTPNEHFSINGDGTVTDKKTNLMWMRCSLGQTWDSNNCSGDTSSALLTWRNALNIAESETFASYTDWRLPNVKELETIIEHSCHSPAINKYIFPGTIQSRKDSIDETRFIAMYWSSSIDSNYSSIAWKVDFLTGTLATQYNDIGGGNTAYIEYPQAARLVRTVN
ncbi:MULTISPECIES: DUF1566 domain-containing protein [unclassified Pseudoalteromonas]|uniref:Lcl C-terminal domain-containing protein n=1 Tax=unclassified Pseudoalteromonas TaxID=194690 RepID=UPI00386E2CE2